MCFSDPVRIPKLRTLSMSHSKILLGRGEQLESLVENLPCDSLKSLRLANDGIFGRVPFSFATLTELVDLDLSHNCLGGPIPEFLPVLFKLETLNLSFNLYQGQLPSTWSSLRYSIAGPVLLL